MTGRAAKSGFTPLEVVSESETAHIRPVASRSPGTAVSLSAAASNRVRCRFLTGFTLIEILTAMAIIVTIVSMVYGSFFAVSQSAQAYKSRLAMSREMRSTLMQMTRQIRCVYVPAQVQFRSEQDGSVHSFKSASPPAGAIAERAANYCFEGNTEGPGGRVLRFVTADETLGGQWAAGGLLEINYSFDRRKGVLCAGYSRFIGNEKNDESDENSQTLLNNVEDVKLSFYDGQKWHKQWGLEHSRQPPRAVKIEISCTDENNRRYSCGTVARIYCWRAQGNKTRDQILASVDKQ